MTEEKAERSPEVRVNLSIFRDENQFLVEHLLTLPKGAARARRLVTLGLIGLLHERATMVTNATAMPAVSLSTQEEGELKVGPTVEKGEDSDDEGYRPRLTSAQLADLMGGNVSSSDE
jgi:hypothetical protein